jgi:hypothetical protein
MTWRFSDGTTVELGGKVEGPSLFAQQLRADIDTGAVQVAIWPLPDGYVDLDVNDPAIMHAWLEHELDVRNRVDHVVIRMRSKPAEIPALPPPPWGDEPEESGVVY